MPDDTLSVISPGVSGIDPRDPLRSVAQDWAARSRPPAGVPSVEQETPRVCPTAPEERYWWYELPDRLVSPGEVMNAMRLSWFLHDENLKISPAEISELARLYYGEFG